MCVRVCGPYLCVCVRACGPYLCVRACVWPLPVCACVYSVGTHLCVRGSAHSRCERRSDSSAVYQSISPADGEAALLQGICTHTGSFEFCNYQLVTGTCHIVGVGLAAAPSLQHGCWGVLVALGYSPRSIWLGLQPFIYCV